MSKVIIAVVIVAIVLGIGSGVIYWKLKNKNISLQTSLSDDKKTGQLAAKFDIESEEIYTDSTGFSFKYPKNLRIKDITPDDYYSFLEMHLENNKEILNLVIKDTQSKTPEEWMKNDLSAPRLATVLGAVVFNNMQAKQYTYKKNDADRLLTASIDSGIIYLIDSPKDSGIWEEIHMMILTSFLKGDRVSSGSSSISSEDASVIYEEEEVVE